MKNVFDTFGSTEVSMHFKSWRWRDGECRVVAGSDLEWGIAA